ncbi:MAG: hypothetical protein HWN81_01050 [Candidatus Lokiarchaeota archaeon]|nr:hypothetical protein [Candidatus Lokiarchaeota archaeon]
MRVSFNKIIISPKDFIGSPMAGYTRKNPCLGKLDDLYAYGVLIEGNREEKGKNVLLLISLDLLKIPIALSNYIKKKIKEKHSSLEADQILIHCTHTHSAPDLTGEFYWPGGLLNVMKGIMFGRNRSDHYIVWFVKQIVRMVEDLIKNLMSCKMAWLKKKFNPDIVINRRHPSRQSIPELGIISFINVDNNSLIGFIVNYSCHPTTLSFQNNKLSADYPGKIIERISQLTHNKVGVIFFNGTAGDLNPITTCGTNYQKLEHDKSLIYDQLGTYIHTKKIGYAIAEKALNLTKSIAKKDYFNDLEFQFYLNYFWIPVKDFNYFSKTWFRNKLIYCFKKYLLLKVARITLKESNFPAFTIKRKKLKIHAKTVIQFVKFNLKNELNSKTIGVITVPGELFEDYGNLFLKKSPTKRENSFVFQNSNDWISYLFPAKDYIEEGGYEPLASFSPVCGYFIEKKMLGLFREIENS